MHASIPPKLQRGDRVVVIAPSNSLAAIEGPPLGTANTALALQRLEGLGLVPELSPNARRIDIASSSSVEERVSDLHAAFADPDVKGIFTAIGGFNANELLDHIDYSLIAAHPKVFCGYSDITVLSAAFLTQAGLVSYSGPHASTLGMRENIDYTLQGLTAALMQNEPYRIEPSERWSEGAWFAEQDDRQFQNNTGYLCLNEGEAEGEIVAGNLTTLRLLQGTRYMPALAGCLLILEDPRAAGEVARNLHSLFHSMGEHRIAGLVLGRFPSSAGATPERLRHMIASLPALRGVPVMQGLDIGHTEPHATIPFGGRARIAVSNTGCRIEILRH